MHRRSMLAAALVAAALTVTGCATQSTSRASTSAISAPDATLTASPSVVTSPVTITVDGEGSAADVTVTAGTQQWSSANVGLPYTTTLQVAPGLPVHVAATNGTSDAQITASVRREGQPVQSATSIGVGAVVTAGDSTEATSSAQGSGQIGDASGSPTPTPTPGTEATK